MATTGKRKTWKQSWAHLKRLGVTLPEDEGGAVDVCDRPVMGQRDFRGLTVRDRVFEEVDFEDLCLMRSLFFECRFNGVSFRNTDLSVCCLAGCQFVDCDFGGARLIRSDLRKCGFFACRIGEAVLIGSDLRGATFEHCDFNSAILTGACLDFAMKAKLTMSDDQRDLMVDWRKKSDRGPDED